MNNYRPDKLSGGGLKALSLSLPGAHRGRPRPRHTATRSTRQPAYEAARLVLQQGSTTSVRAVVPEPRAAQGPSGAAHDARS